MHPDPRWTTMIAPPDVALLRPAPVPDDGWEPPEAPRRRLSLLRILLALVVIAGMGYGGVRLAKARLTPLVPLGKTWFAPYVDVTLPPQYQFQNTSADPARQTVLGFVVASGTGSCSPTWGAAYSLDRAQQYLAVGARIAQMQQDGAQPIVSFGGATHTSLDVACTSEAALTAAYQSVIDRYHLSTIDLDIEAAALSDFPAQRRRAAAIADLQRQARASHRPLSVWLTLPVEPSGLTGDGISVINSMLASGVAISGVNLMTMDFTSPPASGQTMLDLSESALNSAHDQVAGLLGQYHVQASQAQVWQRLGATIMIGQNDVRGESFTTADASGLVGFARRNGLGRVSMWSLNRDSQCGASFPEIGLLSNSCSGTAQSSLQFATILSGLGGTAPTTGSTAAMIPPQPDTNPADAPYPIWSPQAQYPAGYKVVQHGEIYQAKWYNTAQDPAAMVQYSWQTPWELIGPVLAGDHAPALPTLPAATYPAWQAGSQYPAGAKVLYQGLPYAAKWANQGAAPDVAGSLNGSPWKPLFKIPGEPTA
jgi:chitinase